jgi:hypothetical protein
MFEIFKAGNVVKSGTSNLTGFTKLWLEMNIVSAVLLLHNRPNGYQRVKSESVCMSYPENKVFCSGI